MHIALVFSSWNILKIFQIEHPGQKLTILEICLLDIIASSAAKETMVQFTENHQSTVYLEKAVNDLLTLKNCN